MARGSAHAILMGRDNLRPGGVVFHSLCIVMGICQGHALRVDNRDARAGTLRGLVHPVLQLGAGNIGRFGLQNSGFRFQPLFHALHFPSGRVARDVEIQNEQGHRNQQESAGQKLTKYGALEDHKGRPMEHVRILEFAIGDFGLNCEGVRTWPVTQNPKLRSNMQPERRLPSGAVLDRNYNTLALGEQ